MPPYVYWPDGSSFKIPLKLVEKMVFGKSSADLRKAIQEDKTLGPFQRDYLTLLIEYLTSPSSSKPTTAEARLIEQMEQRGSSPSLKRLFTIRRLLNSSLTSIEQRKKLAEELQNCISIGSYPSKVGFAAGTGTLPRHISLDERSELVSKYYEEALIEKPSKKMTISAAEDSHPSVSNVLDSTELKEPGLNILYEKSDKTCRCSLSCLSESILVSLLSRHTDFEDHVLGNILERIEVPSRIVLKSFRYYAKHSHESFSRIVSRFKWMKLLTVKQLESIKSIKNKDNVSFLPTYVREVISRISPDPKTLISNPPALEAFCKTLWTYVKRLPEYLNGIKGAVLSVWFYAFEQLCEGNIAMLHEKTFDIWKNLLKLHLRCIPCFKAIKKLIGYADSYDIENIPDISALLKSPGDSNHVNMRNIVKRMFLCHFACLPLGQCQSLCGQFMQADGLRSLHFECKLRFTLNKDEQNVYDASLPMPEDDHSVEQAEKLLDQLVTEGKDATVEATYRNGASRKIRTSKCLTVNSATQVSVKPGSVASVYLNVKGHNEVTFRCYRIRSAQYIMKHNKAPPLDLELEGIEPVDICVVKRDSRSCCTEDVLHYTIPEKEVIEERMKAGERSGPRVSGMLSNTSINSRQCYIIDAVTSTVSTRIMITRGALKLIHVPSIIGNVFYVLNEQGEVVNDSSIILDGRQYTTTKKGEVKVGWITGKVTSGAIVIPHTDNDSSKTVCVCDGSREEDAETFDTLPPMSSLGFGQSCRVSLPGLKQIQLDTLIFPVKESFVSGCEASVTMNSRLNVITNVNGQKKLLHLNFDDLPTKQIVVSIAIKLVDSDGTTKEISRTGVEAIQILSGNLPLVLPVSSNLKDIQITSSISVPFEINGRDVVLSDTSSNLLRNFNVHDSHAAINTVHLEQISTRVGPEKALVLTDRTGKPSSFSRIRIELKSRYHTGSMRMKVGKDEWMYRKSNDSFHFVTDEDGIVHLGDLGDCTEDIIVSLPINKQNIQRDVRMVHSPERVTSMSFSNQSVITVKQGEVVRFQTPFELAYCGSAHKNLEEPDRDTSLTSFKFSALPGCTCIFSRTPTTPAIADKSQLCEVTQGNIVTFSPPVCGTYSLVMTPQKGFGSMTVVVLCVAGSARMVSHVQVTDDYVDEEDDTDVTYDDDIPPSDMSSPPSPLSRDLINSAIPDSSLASHPFLFLSPTSVCEYVDERVPILCEMERDGENGLVIPVLEIVNKACQEKEEGEEQEEPGLKPHKVHLQFTSYCPLINPSTSPNMMPTPFVSDLPHSYTLSDEAKGRNEEVLYVEKRLEEVKLERPIAGVSLPRPGLLVNPFPEKTTQAEEIKADAGESYSRQRQADLDSRPMNGFSAFGKTKSAPGIGRGGDDPVNLCLDYINQPSHVIASITTEAIMRENGEVMISLPTKQLETFAGGFVRATVLCSDGSTVTRTYALPAQERAKVSTRTVVLESGYDIADRFVLQKNIESLNPSQSKLSFPSFSSRLATLSNIDSLYALSNNTSVSFSQVPCPPAQMSLSDVTKKLAKEWKYMGEADKFDFIRRNYGYELYFFLAFHDIPFFSKYILSLLESKLDEDVMCLWLKYRTFRFNEHEEKFIPEVSRDMVQGVIPYLAPRSLQSLSVLEMVLVVDMVTSIVEWGNAKEDEDKGSHEERICKMCGSMSVFSAMQEVGARVLGIGEGSINPNEEAQVLSACDVLLKTTEDVEKEPQRPPVPAPISYQSHVTRTSSSVSERKRHIPDHYTALSTTKRYTDGTWFGCGSDMVVKPNMQWTSFLVDIVKRRTLGDAKDMFSAKVGRNTITSVFGLCQRGLLCVLGMCGLHLDGKIKRSSESRSGEVVTVFEHAEISDAIVIAEQLKKISEEPEKEGEEKEEGEKESETEADGEEGVQPEFLVRHRFVEHGGSRGSGGRPKTVGKHQMEPGKVYGCEVVILNPLPRRIHIDVLTQIPVGAMPLLGGTSTKTQSLTLSPGPFKAYSFTFYFYLPRTQVYHMMPPQVSKDGCLIGVSEGDTVLDVKKISIVNKSFKLLHLGDFVTRPLVDFIDFVRSRPDICVGSGGAVINAILTRLREKKITKNEFSFLLEELPLLGIPPNNELLLINFVYLNESKELQKLIDSTLRKDLLDGGDGADSYLQRKYRSVFGAALISKWVRYVPTDTLSFVHTDFRPLVEARAHKLTKKSTNGEKQDESDLKLAVPDLEERYRMVLWISLHLPRNKRPLGALLTIVYFLLCQNRVKEAYRILEQNTGLKKKIERIVGVRLGEGWNNDDYEKEREEESEKTERDEEIDEESGDSPVFSTCSLQMAALCAYFDLLLCPNNKLTIARTVSEKYASICATKAIPIWRDFFHELSVQLSEIKETEEEAVIAEKEGTLKRDEMLEKRDLDVSKTDAGEDISHAARNTAAALTTKTLSIALSDIGEKDINGEEAGEATHVTIKTNYKKLEMRVVPVNLELLFSVSPFISQSKKSDDSLLVKVPKKIIDVGKSGQVCIPVQEKGKNEAMLVEVCSLDGSRVKRVLAQPCPFLVHIRKRFGSLKVMTKRTSEKAPKPIKRCYVKCFARMKGGKVQFFKDGYTDRRGVFDYSSVSDSNIANVEEFGLLVKSDEGKGGWVGITLPPQP
ncbi:hypothetical protein ADUPG1_013737 [Aduncisulcus paluster]|uniref:Uncharacterized protein n=1 Tax=Aduncisulcus paluster TaxID=2918883 RepID=A0ABQ5K7I3_9EUKA|nr:hypothetical protein ADUPG1_013737 [Aduncisulcus paluster]